MPPVRMTDNRSALLVSLPRWHSSRRMRTDSVRSVASMGSVIRCCLNNSSPDRVPPACIASSGSINTSDLGPSQRQTSRQCPRTLLKSSSRYQNSSRCSLYSATDSFVLSTTNWRSESMGMAWEVISSGSRIFFSGKTILRQNQLKLSAGDGTSVPCRRSRRYDTASRCRGYVWN